MADPISGTISAIVAGYTSAVGTIAAPFVAALGEGAAIALSTQLVNAAALATLQPACGLINPPTAVMPWTPRP